MSRAMRVQLHLDVINDAAKRISTEIGMNDPEYLTQAMHEVDAIERRADMLRRDLVAQAREHGVSWAKIGHALHCTRQAAQQRFGTTDEVGTRPMI